MNSFLTRRKNALPPSSVGTSAAARETDVATIIQTIFAAEVSSPPLPPPPLPPPPPPPPQSSNVLPGPPPQPEVVVPSDLLDSSEVRDFFFDTGNPDDQWRRALMPGSLRDVVEQAGQHADDGTSSLKRAGETLVLLEQGAILVILYDPDVWNYTRKQSRLFTREAQFLIVERLGEEAHNRTYTSLVKTKCDTTHLYKWKELPLKLRRRLRNDFNKDTFNEHKPLLVN
jgi:hypothetical protein